MNLWTRLGRSLSAVDTNVYRCPGDNVTVCTETVIPPLGVPALMRTFHLIRMADQLEVLYVFLNTRDRLCWIWSTMPYFDQIFDPRHYQLSSLVSKQWSATLDLKSCTGKEQSIRCGFTWSTSFTRNTNIKTMFRYTIHLILGYLVYALWKGWGKCFLFRINHAMCHWIKKNKFF